MAKYRKRPVVIEAVEMIAGEPLPEGVEMDVDGMYVQTLEGRMRVNAGDWIITGVAGERYPCRADIFEATYEPVAERPA
jgi:hypothetical protein